MPAGLVREALAALETFRPHVIVSDVGMPDEDGYALTRRVRSHETPRGAATPAIALSGYAQPEDRARLLAAGFQAHLGKPADPAEIIDMVSALAAPAGQMG